MRFVLVAGATETAGIAGISAAGATREAMVHTPSADAEILVYGTPVSSSLVPVSPTGCPTPAAITRAVRESVDFPVTVLDAGLARPTAAPTVVLAGQPGGDVRDPLPVPNAAEVFETARTLGEGLPDDRIVIGETIPGGTTTALGALTALGEREVVSSSLAENPLSLKREVVEDGLTASDLERGECADDPIRAVERMGDPVLAGVAGLAVGALDSGTGVTLGGGTQMVAAAALVRHAGIESSLSLATTSFVATDVDLDPVVESLDLLLSVTDPEFATANHESMARYVAGEAKEGVGMGGALAEYADSGDAVPELHDRIVAVYDRLLR
ncbi:nicotinate mononucleotide-dependent phosphoribosyltransferase CobT [Natronorarus salvus]|uniref:nicotinate mononucleotide-dependent phosphoribosyltransferase CobT n=1 Tax=Natronorarus salvus TaxID=3117733 RepID=UPI002F268340